MPPARSSDCQKPHNRAHTISNSQRNTHYVVLYAHKKKLFTRAFMWRIARSCVCVLFVSRFCVYTYANAHLYYNTNLYICNVFLCVLCLFENACCQLDGFRKTESCSVCTQRGERRRTPRRYRRHRCVCVCVSVYCRTIVAGLLT